MVSVEDKDWLLNVFPQYLNHPIRGVHKDAFIRAETILAGKATLPGCSCRMNAYKNKVQDLYQNWLSNEQQIH